MKLFLITLCLVLAAMAEDKYESVNDDFDVNQVLKNDRLLNSYVNCLLGKGACTPEVKQVKDKLPEALATHCAKCTDKQKQMGKQLAHEVKNKRPELWQELVQKYDPKGQYQEAFKDFFE